MPPAALDSSTIRVAPAALRGCAVHLDWPCHDAGLPLAQLQRWIEQAGGRLWRGPKTQATLSVSLRRSTTRVDERYGVRDTPTISPTDLLCVLSGQTRLADAIAAAYTRTGRAPLTPPEPFNWLKAARQAAFVDDDYAVAF